MGFFLVYSASCSAIKFSRADGTLVVTLQLSPARDRDWEQRDLERGSPSFELPPIATDIAAERSSALGHNARSVQSQSIPPPSNQHEERSSTSQEELERALPRNKSLASRCVLWMTACKARLLTLCRSRRTTEHDVDNPKATGPIEVRVDASSGDYARVHTAAGNRRCLCLSAITIHGVRLHGLDLTVRVCSAAFVVTYSPRDFLVLFVFGFPGVVCVVRLSMQKYEHPPNNRRNGSRLRLPIANRSTIVTRGTTRSMSMPDE